MNAPASRILAIGFLLTSVATAGAQALPGPPVFREFPVTLNQKIVAGKTAAGTKVEAKLTVATMMNGAVLPKGAIFSGEVTESAGKSAPGGSRLALRMNSVEWKDGSAPVKVYLTAWYYPVRIMAAPNLNYGPPGDATWNGAGAYPVPDSPAVKPFPSDNDRGPDGVPQVETTMLSEHRQPIKNVRPEPLPTGGVVLTSEREIKLDKVTTYVLAPAELLPHK